MTARLAAGETPASSRSSTRKRYPTATAANSGGCSRSDVCPARDGWQTSVVPMREECKNYESRTYPNGETVRKCNLDLAPDAPWRCPDPCPRYERRLADVNWAHGTLIAPPTPQEPPGLDDGIGGRRARRGRGHHQHCRAARSSPRCRPSKAGARSGGVFRRKRIASDREPLHRSTDAVAPCPVRPGCAHSAGLPPSEPSPARARPSRGDLALQPHRRARPRSVCARPTRLAPGAPPTRSLLRSRRPGRRSLHERRSSC